MTLFLPYKGFISHTKLYNLKDLEYSAEVALATIIIVLCCFFVILELDSLYCWVRQNDNCNDNKTEE